MAMRADIVGRGASLDNLSQVLWADRRELMSRLADYRCDEKKWNHLIRDGMIPDDKKWKWARDRIKGDIIYTSMMVSQSAWKYADDLERTYITQIPPLPATIQHYRRMAHVYWDMAGHLMFGPELLVTYEECIGG